MQIEVLVHKLGPFSPLVHKFGMRLMAKSFESFLAIDLMHVESELDLRKWDAQFSAILSLSLSPPQPWNNPHTPPLCVHEPWLWRNEATIAYASTLSLSTLVY